MIEAPRTPAGPWLTAGLAAALLLASTPSAEAFMFGPRRSRATTQPARVNYVPAYYVPSYYVPAYYTPPVVNAPVASTVASPVSCPSCQSTPTITSASLPATSFNMPATTSFNVPANSACPTGNCSAVPQQLAVTQTCMTQRCYLAPVTSYQLQTAYDNVTEYQTSTYLEPVTTMRTSTYYDACSCSYYQCATPQTSYVTRQSVTPVTRQVARNYYAPVTTYQQQCVQVPEQRVQYYVPAGTPAASTTPAVSNYVAPQIAPAVTTSNFLSSQVAPAPAAGTTQNFYLSPQINANPAPAAQPQQQAAAASPDANAYVRNYGPASADGSRVLIERFYDANGQVVDERRRVIPSGQDVPAPNPNGYDKQQSGQNSLWSIPAAPARQALTSIPAPGTSPYYR